MFEGDILELILHKIWNIFWHLCLVIVSIYIIIIILFTLFQSRFIYFPHREIIMTPDQAGLSYNAVQFISSDGIKLSGWFIPAENSQGVVLFCHGNAGNISHRMDSIRIFNNLRLSIFIFDYRGYGLSKGKPSEQGTYLDAEAAWYFLIRKQNIKPDNIIIFGRSLGGNIAAWLAKKHKPGALIIESTFTSIPNIGADLYPLLPISLLSRYNYNALDYIQNVKCPVLIVHSRNDEMIPFKHGKFLFEAANQPKQMLEIRGSHNDGFVISGQLYTDGLNNFISGHIGK